MDRRVFRVAMDLVGVCGLLAARHYAGAGEALVHSYLGNVSASPRSAIVSAFRDLSTKADQAHLDSRRARRHR